MDCYRSARRSALCLRYDYIYITFLFFCSLVNYFRIRLFSGHHIVHFLVMGNCNSNSSLVRDKVIDGDEVVARYRCPVNCFMPTVSF